MVINHFKKNSKNKLIFYFLFFIFTIKIFTFYFTYHLKPIYDPDTYTYMSAAYRIVNFHLDEYRTIGFPIILGFLKTIFNSNFDIALVIVNIISSTVSYYFTFLIIKKINIKHAVFLLLTYIILDFFYIEYDFTILTESICKSLIIILIYQIIENKNTFAIASLLFFTKPIFFTLIILFIALLMLRKNKKDLLTSIVILSISIFYSFLFKSEFGYFNLSCVSNYNSFSQIIQLKIFKNKDYPLFTSKIEEFYKNKANNRYLIQHETIGLNKIFTNSFQLKYANKNLNNYISSTLNLHKMEFYKLQLEKFSKDGQSMLIYGFPYTNSIIKISVFAFSIIMFILLFISLFSIPIKTSIRELPIYYPVLCYSILTIAIVFIGSPGDYNRLILPFFPIHFISIVFFIQKTFFTSSNLPN